MHTGMTDIKLKTLKDNLWHSADKLRAGAHQAAKNLYKKLMEEKDRVMVVDWYKDEQPKKKALVLSHKRVCQYGSLNQKNRNFYLILGPHAHCAMTVPSHGL